tara:strand:+ start:1767 stop:2183 length:417 start_codon:yes stop_codon:yes gene_type:complete
MKNIYLLSCVKTKLSKPSVAVDMYISPLFKKMLSYAQSKEADEIFILSAEYGLLERSQVIDPYEKTLRTMKKKEREIWADTVMTELIKKSDVKCDNFIFLAGKMYRENLVTGVKNYSVPMEGLGMGEQLAWLGKHTDV